MRIQTTSWCLALLLAGAACTAPLPPPSIAHEPATRRDSILYVSVQLGRMVHLLDDVARPGGRLPETLERILLRYPNMPDHDLWGTPVRYSPDSMRFELRSAGPDGRFYTSDDIVSSGHLGRVLPCETRHGLGTETFENYAPACSEVDIIILPKCPQLLAFRELVEIGVTALDSVAATGRNLVGLARMIDGYGRTIGTLPGNLRQVVSNRKLVDTWERQVMYITRGRSFELRSAGPDGLLNTDDDIFLEATLGTTIECAYNHRQERLSCSDAPPRCPVGNAAAG